MRAVSNDIRNLIVNAKQKGKSNEEIIEWLSVSVSSITLIWRQYNKTGNISPKTNEGRVSRLTLDQIQGIHDLIKEKADVTLAEMIEILNLPIQKSQLSKWLIKNGYTYKKKRYILIK